MEQSANRGPRRPMRQQGPIAQESTIGECHKDPRDKVWRWLRLPRWRTWLAALSGCAGCALTAPAAAAFDHFLASTIVGTMTQAEARSFAGAVDKALRKREDGAGLRWQAPETPRHPATEAVITPLQTRQDRGQACRQVRSELRRASNQEQWTGWFCQQIDGRWRARAVEQ